MADSINDQKLRMKVVFGKMLFESPATRCPKALTEFPVEQQPRQGSGQLTCILGVDQQAGLLVQYDDSGRIGRRSDARQPGPHGFQIN